MATKYFVETIEELKLSESSAILEVEVSGHIDGEQYTEYCGVWPHGGDVEYDFGEDIYVEDIDILKVHYDEDEGFELICIEDLKASVKAWAEKNLQKIWSRN